MRVSEDMMRWPMTQNNPRTTLAIVIVTVEVKVIGSLLIFMVV